MDKENNHEQYEQLVMDGFHTIDTQQSYAVAEADTPKSKKAKGKRDELVIGAKVVINDDVKLFCDGRGIPDYARTAYVKGMDNNTKTILIETKPGGKELGVLFANNVTMV